MEWEPMVSLLAIMAKMFTVTVDQEPLADHPFMPAVLSSVAILKIEDGDLRL
jgi:hypothetical protein